VGCQVSGGQNGITLARTIDSFNWAGLKGTKAQRRISDLGYVNILNSSELVAPHLGGLGV
jgi:hypothetical protein